jgi:hypothetical protein
MIHVELEGNVSDEPNAFGIAMNWAVSRHLDKVTHVVAGSRGGLINVEARLADTASLFEANHERRFFQKKGLPMQRHHQDISRYSKQTLRARRVIVSTFFIPRDVRYGLVVDLTDGTGVSFCRPFGAEGAVAIPSPDFEIFRSPGPRPPKNFTAGVLVFDVAQ